MKILSRAKKIFSRDSRRSRRLRIRNERREKREAENWRKWLETNRVADKTRDRMRSEIVGFYDQPLISIVTPVYNIEEKWLRRCIESVLGQIYENWEFCIADDCSPLPHIKKILVEYAAKDKRIKTVFRESNGHISAASNSALRLATGEFTALLDHDDEITEDALFHVVKEINRFPVTDMIYTDEDTINERGERYDPKFKPDWSRDYFYSVNYTTHFAVYRTEILRRIGGWQIGLEGSQDYDLALRVGEQIPDENIRHIPRILYHWRAVSGSVALSGDEKPYAHERARQAIRAHFERSHKRATVSETVNNLHRVRYDLPESLPKAALILIAEKSLEANLSGLKNYLEQTAYENLEIILVCSKAIKSKFKIADLPSKVKILICEETSETKKLNFAAAETAAELLCFADINLRPLAVDWLKELIGFALQEEIGAVGGKITDAEETILHGGFIIGGENRAVGVAHRGFSRENFGNIGRLQLIGNFSAVSASCLATRREVFLENAGFDAEHTPNKFYDADFCLRLREKNHRIIFTPYAELRRFDVKKRLNLEKKSTAAEENYFRNRWQQTIGNDPFYNPNFSYKKETFSIKI